MSVELKLYEVDLKTEVAPALYGILSAEERDFAENIRNEILKKQHVKVRIAVRQILASYFQQTADQINITKTKYGKPYLPDYPDIHFNISHSADTLLVAISQIGVVGVDIEQAKPQRRDFSGLVAKCFAASEIEYWKALPDTEKTAEFYRFWTRKEAFVKAVGRGLAIGLEHCVIATDNPLCFIRLPENYPQPSDWRLFDLALKPNLYGALVVDSRKIPTNFVLPEITLFQINHA